MTLIPIGSRTGSEQDTRANRVFPVTVKLTQEEHLAVTEFAKSRKLARGEWMRNAILRELRCATSADPVFAEIIGVRLLLVNVLRSVASGQTMPQKTFDKILDEIGRAKHELAEKLASERRK